MTVDKWMRAGLIEGRRKPRGSPGIMDSLSLLKRDSLRSTSDRSTKNTINDVMCYQCYSVK